MKIKLPILFIVSIFLNFNSFSQNLAAFTNYKKNFIIFDKGQTKQVEFLPVKSYKIGGNAVAFITNNSKLKVYSNGVVKTLEETFSGNYYVTKKFVVYSVFKQLYVFDNGKTKLLSSYVGHFSVKDNIISFYDKNSKAIKIYYKEKIWSLAKSLIGMPFKYFKTGTNTFAYYNDNSKYLMYFIDGKLIKIAHINGLLHFKCGKNILAYTDIAMNTFNVYYNNKNMILEYFKPKKVEVGKNMIAYTDNLEEFKLFTEGKTITISSFEPDFFTIIDNLLLFSEPSGIKIYYNNTIHDVCDYVPNNYKIQHSTFAYIDLNKKLKAFTKGKLITVTHDFVKSFEIAYDIIIIKINGNKTQIYYNNKLYRI